METSEQNDEDKHLKSGDNNHMDIEGEGTEKGEVLEKKRGREQSPVQNPREKDAGTLMEYFKPPTSSPLKKTKTTDLKENEMDEDEPITDQFGMEIQFSDEETDESDESVKVLGTRKGNTNQKLFSEDETDLSWASSTTSKEGDTSEGEDPKEKGQKEERVDQKEKAEEQQDKMENDNDQGKANQKENAEGQQDKEEDKDPSGKEEEVKKPNEGENNNEATEGNKEKTDHTGDNISNRLSNVDINDEIKTNSESHVKKLLKQGKVKKKQKRIVEASKEGKPQLATGYEKQDEHDDLTGNEILITDDQLKRKKAKQRRRPNVFRANFMMEINEPEGSTNQKKRTALKQLRDDLSQWDQVDPTIVFYTWYETSDLIAGPLTPEDIDPDTDIKRYCKNIYITKSNPDKVKIEMVIGTVLTNREFDSVMGDHLAGGHHGRLFRNQVNATRVVLAGYAVMSTKEINCANLATRLSEDSGFSIGARVMDILVESEREEHFKTLRETGNKGLGVQAVHFECSFEDKDEVIDYLDALMIGEYTRRQLMLCPLMKFCLMPGELTGRKNDKMHKRLKRKQSHFTSNVMKCEILTAIREDIDNEVEGLKYTLRQCILLLKNKDPATKDSYPKLFYDVDFVGKSSKVRFVFYKFLHAQAEEAAEHILALLQRTYGARPNDIQEFFTLKAQREAIEHRWSMTGGGPENLDKAKAGLSDRALMLCGGDDDESSAGTEKSYEELDELDEAREKGVALSTGVLRKNVRFRGSHARGSDSLKTSHRVDQPKNVETASISFDVDDLVQETKTLASAPMNRTDASMTSTIATTTTAAVGRAIDIQGIPAMAHAEQIWNGSQSQVSAMTGRTKATGLSTKNENARLKQLVKQMEETMRADAIQKEGTTDAAQGQQDQPADKEPDPNISPEVTEQTKEPRSPPPVEGDGVVK